MSVTDLGSRAGRFGSPRNIRPFSASSGILATGRGVVSVTAGRTGGVGRPTSGQALLSTASGPQMVGEAVRTALQSIEVLNRHAADIAEAFRGDDPAGARRGLRDLLHGTDTLVQLAALSAQVLGVDLRSLRGADGLKAESETREVVDQLMAQLLAQDWTAVARTLDEDFITALGSWRGVIDAISAAPTSVPGPAA